MRHNHGFCASTIPLRLLLVLSLMGGCAPTKPAAPTTKAASPDPKRFEAKVAAFEKEDQQSPSPAKPILFVGSSTIAIWKTSDDYPGLPVLNRGIGASHISDVLYFYDRLVLRYHPKTIVFYSGDNDLANGKPPAQVAQDAKTFIDKVRHDLPQARLVFIAVKPSNARWNLIEQIRQTNQMIRKLVEAKSGDVFLDVESQVLGPDGKPRPELFRADGLHFSAKGYEMLNEAVRPYVH